MLKIFVSESCKLDQRIIDLAVRKCRKPLRACVEAKGGQLE